MRILWGSFVAFNLLGFADPLWAQNPWLFPNGYPYANKAEWQQQQAFDNQLRMRQQLAWEARNPEREYVLDYMEQVRRIRALRAQEDYYRAITPPRPRQKTLAERINEGLPNPFYK